MSLFLIFFTYKKSLFFRGSMPSAYRFNLLSLSYLLLKIVKAYQPHNLWYILRMEVTHDFTLECNQFRVINHGRYLILRVSHLSHYHHIMSHYWVALPPIDHLVVDAVRAYQTIWFIIVNVVIVDSVPVQYPFPLSIRSEGGNLSVFVKYGPQNWYIGMFLYLEVQFLSLFISLSLL